MFDAARIICSVRKRLAVLVALLVVMMPAAYAQRRRAVAGPLPQPSDPCAAATLLQNTYSGDVEVDATYVYFADDQGDIFRMAKNSPLNSLPELLGSVPDFVQVIAIDSTNIYALTSNSTDGGVWSLPKSGGTPQQLANGIIAPFEIAADGNNVYWVSAGTPTFNGFNADGKIEKVSKNGTGRVALATGLNLPTSVVSDGTNVFFGETGLSSGNSSKGLRSVSVNGGTVRKLTNNTGVVGLTLSGNDVFFANVDFFTGGELLRMPKGGGNSTSLVKGVGIVPRLVVSGDRLYFFDNGSAQVIEYIPIAGGTRKIAVGGTFIAEQFAMDDCAIYSVDGQGALIRTPR